MRIAAAILAGGKASRLGGIAKGMLPGSGSPSIVGRLIEELAAAGIADVVISANNSGTYASFGKPIVADIHAEIGPLGGIEAVLEFLAPRCEGVILLPCDLPNLTAEEILKLLRAQQTQTDSIAIAITKEGDQPLCAVVPVSVLPAIKAAIARREHGVGRLWRSLGAMLVEIDDASRLVNINTPDDLRQWREK